jgi:GDP-L-fucose synthase
VSSLIKADDRFFVAGARGMAGSAICRALQEKGYGDEAKGGALLTPNGRVPLRGVKLEARIP